MNWTMECGWALLRALAVAALALGAGALLYRLLRSAHPRLRIAAWALLPIPWLTPISIVGYFYSNCALSLIHHPTLNILLYHLILCARLAPVAALVLLFAPSEMSDAALHCHRLLTARCGLARHWLFRLRASARPAAVAFCFAFLMAFAEFELGTLMYVNTWTVRLFDAHVGGVPIVESLRRVALPGVLEALVLLGGYLLLAGARGPAQVRSPIARGGILTWLAAGLLALSLVVVAALPFFVVIRDAVIGFGPLFGSFAIGSQLFASVFFASVASAAAWLLAGWASRRAWTAWMLSLPGLLGALVLSLTLLGLFQLPGLRLVWNPDTSIEPLRNGLKLLPLSLALTLLLLPFALIMRRLFRAHSSGSGFQAARMLRSSERAPVRARGARLARFIRARGRFWALFLLFSLAFFDLTASSILAPTGPLWSTPSARSWGLWSIQGQMTPVSVTLYNLMHYGRSQVLSAMVLVAFAVPLLLLAVAAAGRGLYNRMNGNA